MLGGGGVDDHCQFSKGGVSRVLVREVRLRCLAMSHSGVLVRGAGIRVIYIVRWRRVVPWW
jgi:hypothetical protein